MSKNDKELTVDIVNTVIQSWNARANAALTTSEINDLIKSIYGVLHDLPTD